MVDDVDVLTDKQKIRDELEADFRRGGAPGPALPALGGPLPQRGPSRESWGLGPEAERGMAGMMQIAGGQG